MIPRAVRLAVWGLGATLVVLALGAAASAAPLSLALGAGGLALLIFAAGLTHRARRAAEEALRRSEEQFRRAIVDAPIPILMHAEDGEVLVLSQAWTRLSGYSRDDIPTLGDWLDKAYGPAAGQVRDRIRRSFEGGTGGTEVELVIRTRDGEGRIWTFTAGEPGRLPDGRLFLVTMATDVTERRQADEALHDSQERLRMAVEGTGLGTWDFNPVTGRMTWSERCKEIHGLPRDAEIDYGEYLVRIHPEDWDRVHQAMQEALEPASPGGYEVEYRALAAEGAVRWVISRGCTFFRGDGADRHATRFIGTVMDVTERKQAEEELRQAKEAAEAANRAKDQFLATLSHELRTPLTPVLALVSGLEGDGRMRDVADRLAMIRRNVELEARLIDDLLDLTRIARGKLELQRAMCDVRALVEHAIQICCAESCDAGRLKVVTELAASEHRVWGDGSRLMQIFWNLLRNSVKFTPEGGTIVVRTWNALGELVVEITDTGVGIEPGSIPQIFEAFSQGAPARGGLGLGLSISKAVADLHGGRITALSPGYGLGATFRVELPTGGWPAEAEPAPSQAPEPPARRPLRLLLVEDHSDTAEAMAELLRSLGHEVRVAMSVAAGLDAAAAEIGSGAGIDLVISDLGLPDGNGMDLMRQLVSRYGLRGIALSGYGSEDDVRRSLEAGFSRHLTKPVNFKALEAVIHETAGARPA
ncbi:MAG TPA: ATP-binding protein [Thermoanaerobaculia bacterium]|nr:ATP-binding protein [Thermoanaerobaculia bacterium]